MQAPDSFYYPSLNWLTMQRFTKSKLNSQTDGVPSSQGSPPVYSPVLTRGNSVLRLIALEDRVLYNAVPFAAVEMVQSTTETTDNSLPSIDDGFDSIELAMNGLALISQDRSNLWEETNQGTESSEFVLSTLAMDTDVAVSVNPSVQASLQIGRAHV